MAGNQPGAASEGPTGEGWVIQLKGYHYHNANPGEEEGGQYVVSTLMKNLQSGTVDLPVPQGNGKPPLLKSVPISALGISCPVLIRDPRITDEERDDPNLENDPAVANRKVKLRRYEFTVQFCWQETPPSKRLANEEAARTGMPAATAQPAGTVQ